jgi:hypothetical protein
MAPLAQRPVIHNHRHVTPTSITVTFTEPIDGSLVLELAEIVRVEAAMLGLALVATISVRCQPGTRRGELPADTPATIPDT